MSALCYKTASCKEKKLIICFVKAKNNLQTTKAGSKHISHIFAFMITFLTFSAHKGTNYEHIFTLL